MTGVRLLEPPEAATAPCLLSTLLSTESNHCAVGSSPEHSALLSTQLVCPLLHCDFVETATSVNRARESIAVEIYPQLLPPKGKSPIAPKTKTILYLPLGMIVYHSQFFQGVSGYIDESDLK